MKSQSADGFVIFVENNFAHFVHALKKTVFSIRF